MKVKTIKAVGQLKSLLSTPGMYVRWSRGPAMDAKQGVSRDYANGGCHNGLSAVPAEDWHSQRGEGYMAVRVTEYRFLKMKDERISCYLYAAVRVGTDSDGYAAISTPTEAYKISPALLAELVAMAKAHNANR